MEGATPTSTIATLSSRPSTFASDPGQDKRDRQWDCESILSTKSTLYNHPATIELAKKKRKGKKKPTDSGKIELDPRGIPVRATQSTSSFSHLKCVLAHGSARMLTTLRLAIMLLPG